MKKSEKKRNYKDLKKNTRKDKCYETPNDA